MHETNFAIQTVILAIFLVSMTFRVKGKYLVHGIIMAVLVAIGWVVVLISLPNFLDSSIMQTYTSPSSTLVVFGIHMFFGLATLISATWLVALWRPHSTEFPAKSKRIAKTTTILWVSAYVVGILFFVALTTTLL
jgi:hypothetical protein